MKKAQSLILTSLIVSMLLAAPAVQRSAATDLAIAGKDDEATIYRDEYGIPHVFSKTLEMACLAVGYAQAEDRLEELLKNYRRASGTMSEVFGPAYYRSDLVQRMWRHQSLSREKYNEVSPKIRACLEAYQDGKGSRYRYAVAPMSIYQLEARYKERLVWSVEQRYPGRRNSRSYYADYYAPDLGETLPD